MMVLLPDACCKRAAWRPPSVLGQLLEEWNLQRTDQVHRLGAKHNRIHTKCTLLTRPCNKSSKHLSGK